MVPQQTDVPRWRKEAEAHKRAMPLQRLLGNGMDFADAHALYAAVDSGESWADAADAIGSRNQERALEAEGAGRHASAIGWYRRAAACFRFGQVPLDDSDPRKPRLYERLIASYRAAGRLLNPPVERIEVEFSGHALAGWLQLPAEVVSERPRGTVVIFGGFDGWREEYDTGAQALNERGLATCLVDLPGQGEARVLNGAHMPEDPDGVVTALGAFLTALTNHTQLGGRIGVWGNSLGGYLAARAACRDPRIDALCINGGSDRPAEVLQRYPGFIRKVELLFGVHDPARAAAYLNRMTLTPRMLSELTSPLLILHGRPDRIFLFESAERILRAAASADKTLLAWSDGDHCIYNHTADKHAIVADWFVHRLTH